tara:strand:+ start:473 stop:979 length:507 start_codon:yes stop_codon:yes gene_type:complete
MITRVDKVWKKPTLKKLIKWWKVFSSFNVHRYDYYLVGGFINKQKTKDIDIVVTGDVKDDLSIILTLGKMLGEKDDILIDMFWSDVLDPFPNNEYKPLIKIRNFNKLKITRNNKTKIYDYGGTKISDDLYKTIYKIPNKGILKGKDYKNKFIKIQEYIDGTRNRSSLL